MSRHRKQRAQDRSDAGRKQLAQRLTAAFGQPITEEQIAEKQNATDAKWGGFA